MARIILALLALAFHLGAQAQTIGLHLVSAHQHGGLNGINPGVYVRFGNGATVGTYRNSYRRQSTHPAWTFETEPASGFSAALTVGAITGYGVAHGQQYCAPGYQDLPGYPCQIETNAIRAIAMPSAAYHAGAYAGRLGIIPRPGAKGVAGLHLMVETHF
jgi:hypothetical protein